MNKYRCPVCGAALSQVQRSYQCENRHSFDIAKSGYVNLLLSRQQGKTVHGDNKLMVAARRDFLEKDYYKPLKDALCKAVCSFAKNEDMILDAGCGEGYYTAAVSDALRESGIIAEICGVDISKTAVEFAAKRKKPIDFCAASVFHLPVTDHACDMLLSLFSPYCGEEFRRVLKKGGYMILAIPSTMHLWELKQAVYDTPYQNEVKPYELEGFTFLHTERIHTVLHLDNPEDIQNLFSMTPYYYKTGKKERECLLALAALDTQADFELLVYRCE